MAVRNPAPDFIVGKISSLHYPIYYYFLYFQILKRCPTYDERGLLEQHPELGPPGLGGGRSDAGHSRPVSDLRPEVLPGEAFVRGAGMEQEDVQLRGNLLPEVQSAREELHNPVERTAFEIEGTEGFGGNVAARNDPRLLLCVGDSRGKRWPWTEL